MSRVHFQRPLELFTLWRTLVAQDVAVRYRGTLLGRAWPVIMPLVMLAVYGFVFGAVFRARWPGLADGDHLGFALNLFTGLLVHGLFAEAVGQSPGLMQRNSNFVRKMVFPLPVLVAVPLGSALVHAVVGFALLVVVNGTLGEGWHLSALAAPLILLPYLALLYGLALVFAGLGVYLRDLGQVATVLVMIAMFTGTVFFPRSMVPPALAGVIDINPISWPTEALRDCILRGIWPDPSALGLYFSAAAALLALGWLTFSVLRRGFADLL
ncbi:ABC transporter permease [Aerolutibacter ruishenii]|uniref:Transport permease protein n=1 Tax=Aerolutibacter ruishenii TaxID=686800 RepID=A0A562M322_9GAMM|nr:ABC transporter permease [Lysobacter ruishenii]TWI14270.1 lipopolysaccharide transport system permease protein [Lysobacter ruishenii]